MAACRSAPALAALQGRDFLSSADLSAEQTQGLLELAADLKAGRCQIDLGGRSLGLIKIPKMKPMQDRRVISHCHPGT